MSRKKKGLILLGLLLIAAALFLVAYNIHEEMAAKEFIKNVVIRLQETVSETKSESVIDEKDILRGEIEIPDYILSPGMDMPAENIEGQDYIGLLAISSLELQLPVISQWSDSLLKIAPCRYSGSPYMDNLILAGSNYKSHFGKIKNLRVGDRVTFTDLDANVFIYEVAELYILTSPSFEQMISEECDLYLFTRTTGGQSQVIVCCERVQE
ncbi:MAG: sortase [Tissierellia bacterium]|nr:sortase [Bacillota bacterium]NLL22427.1 sortase [Tissierellia bacterium]